MQQGIATLFAHRADRALNAASLPKQGMGQAITPDDGHGREKQRPLIASTDLNDYLGWPGMAQVFTVEGVWQDRRGEHRSVCFGVTSLPATAADAARLLARKCHHWGIENGWTM